MTDKPTDAELQALWSEAVLPDTVTKRLAFSFARAVLAKWGSPAQAGEAVAWRVRRHDAPNYWIVFLHYPVDAMADSEREVQPLFATPQPTHAQAGALPLTPERVKEIVLGAGYDQCGIPDTERAAFISGLRHGEQAHGIKGGQHEPKQMG